MFAPLGCRGNTTHTEISPVKQAHTRGNVVMFVPSRSELSNKFTNSTDAGDYMLGPIREENRIVDRLLYVDPYEAVSQTMAYVMMHSKAEDHFNQEYLPTAALYFPINTC